MKQNLRNSEELEHRVVIELIVGLAQRVKRHAFHGKVKLTEGAPTLLDHPL